METSHAATLHLELDIEIHDPAAVQASARAWAQDRGGKDPETLAHMLGQAGEGPESALMLMVEPDDVLAHIQGVTALGAAMWVSNASGDSGNWPQDQAPADGDDGGGDGLEGEGDWLDKITADAAKLPGLDLQRLGYNPDLDDPEARARSLQEATTLRGAIHWAWETVIDELFDDVAVLRETPRAIAATLQLSSLPPLHRASYGPLFAQRYLAVALDLGTAFATSFDAPSCVAQELALRLVLDGAALLPDLLPNLELPGSWRGLLEDTLFEDLDHQTLYDPALDGLSHDPRAASLGMANLDVSSWFSPFTAKTVNPYAANE